MALVLYTPRLQLIATELKHITAYHQGPQALAALLEVKLGEGWPVFPDAYPYWESHLRKDPSLVGWLSWLFIHVADKVLVGDGGFHGPPTEEGAVELGYALVPSYRGQGLATEAAQALTSWAFSHPHVAELHAETEPLPEGLASQRVLQKLGMQRLEVKSTNCFWWIGRKE